MKIYIDRCHGCGQDRGASGFLNEETMSDKMIDLVIPKLKSLGHTVLAQRPSGNLTVSQSLNWRCQQANSWGADIFISNHNNAGGGYGAEVYTYKGELLPEATRYLQYIINHGGSVHSNDRKNANAGVKDGSGLAVVNGTSMKSMLLENFYVDTKSDCDFFSNNVEMFANALVYGITGVNLENGNTNVEERKKVDYIVVYSNDVDKRAAEYLADYLSCPTIAARNNFDYTRVETVYAVGGDKGTYTGYLRDENFITGADRYESCRNVLKRIGKL